MSEQTKILMLYTGGTIGMIQDENNQSLIPFNFEHLLDRIPEIKQMDCQIDTDSLDKPIDSSNIKPEHWLRLSERIVRDYEDYDAFVILHGSDTMAYTSSALSFLLDHISKPVILTGSQLPIGVARSDARENLLTTLEIAMAKKENGSAMVPEVAVYFEYDLFRGNRIHKASAEDFEAFESLNYPKLASAGVHIKFNPEYILAPSTLPICTSDNMEERVGILSMFPGITPSFVKSVLSNTDLKGFIIRTFGSGNAPMDDWLIEEIHTTIKRGIPVVNISQCSGGGVRLGKYEASKALKEIGVISGGDMTLEAGLTKMMYLLPKYPLLTDFKKVYETNLRGELTL